jgi:DNA polymerase III epsilon subunit-like protein
MVQVAWVLMDTRGQELAAHCHIIRPDGFSIPMDAVRVHGITTEIARLHGVDVNLALDELEHDLPQARLLIGHNIEFDHGVVGAEFFRAGRARNPLDTMQRYCTMKTTTELCRIRGGYGGFKWPTLDELHQTLFHQRLKAGHDALTDARACARCYFALLDRASPANVEDDLPEDDAETDGDAAGELLEEIYDLAGDQSWFDTEFVDSLNDQYEERGWISEAQMVALEKIRDMLERRSR